MKKSGFSKDTKVFVEDFTLNGVKFNEKFSGVIALNNGDGTYDVNIAIRGRVANVIVKESSLSHRA